MKKAARRRANPALLNQLDLFASLAAAPESACTKSVPEPPPPLTPPPLPPPHRTKEPCSKPADAPLPAVVKSDRRKKDLRASRSKKAEKSGKSAAKKKGRRPARAAQETGKATPMRRFTPEEAAEMLAVSMKTLEAWRRLGKGPRFVKLGRAVRYALEDLEDFSNARTVSNSAEGRMLDAPH
jgi:type IV secretory pathway VirB10-like protein